MAPVWARNRLKRVVKTDYGHVLESFVFSELLKHTITSDDYYRLLYYRDGDKFEIDVVIENSAGQLVGVEVKAYATVKESDLRGLKKLVSLAGDQLAAGVILYDGDETMPLDSNLRAASPVLHSGVHKAVIK